jgi:hypothetical protein
LQAQLEELRNGRDHLLDAYRTVKRTFLEATEALAQAEARAAAGKPVPSVDPDDVESAIAAETASAAATEAPAAEGVAPVVDVVDVVDVDLPAEAEAEAEVGPLAGDAEVSPTALADVESLFARIRAGAETPEDEPEPEAEPAVPEVAAAVEQATDVVPETVTEAPEVVAEPSVDVRSPWRDKEAEAIGPLVGPVVKLAKRAAQDEQNALLDTLRRFKGQPKSPQVLQSDADTIVTWAAVVRSGLDAGYGAGRTAVGGEMVPAPPDLAEEAVRYLVDALRERLATAIDDDNDGFSTSLVIERIGARYREWKLQSLEGMVGDVLTSAWSRGVFDAVPDGTLLQWVPAEVGRCPDCDDNALEPTLKGEAFPTGQPHPPAHPGCRCILAPANAT